MIAVAVTSTTILAVLVAISNAIVAVFGYMLALHNTKNDKSTQKEEKKKEAEKQLKDACDNGTLSDLLDATKKIGESKK